jgi:hypothetical protein
MVRWRPGGQRSLAAAGAVSPHPFTAPTERTPANGSASNGPSFMAAMVRWRPGGQRFLAAAGAVGPHPFTAPTERTPSERIGQQWAIVRGSYGPMEAWRAAVPRCRRCPKSAPFHGADGADALQRIGQQWAIVRGAMVRCRPGGQRSLAAAGALSPHRFTAPTERTPSKEVENGSMRFHRQVPERPESPYFSECVWDFAAHS